VAASNDGAPADVPAGVADDPLWRVIAAHEFEDGVPVRSFLDRLAQEQGWPRAYAEAAIGEYRRFCYLAGKADHIVVPSDAVDQVWHQHLLYSENYWRVFCPDVLGRDFHHVPARGDVDDADRMRRDYAATLADYENVFGRKPPAAFWPDTAERFGHPHRHRRVDMRNYVAIPRLDKPKRIGLIICIVGLIVAIATL